MRKATARPMALPPNPSSPVPPLRQQQSRRSERWKDSKCLLAPPAIIGGAPPFAALRPNKAWPSSCRSPPRRKPSPGWRDLLKPPTAEERSEEHTSELQSLMRISYAVFCLKKKTQTNTYNTNHNTKQQ